MSERSRQRQKDRERGQKRQFCFWNRLKSHYIRLSEESGRNPLAQDLRKFGLDSSFRFSWNQWPFATCFLMLLSWKIGWMLMGEGNLFFTLIAISLGGFLIALAALPVSDLPYFSFRYLVQLFAALLLTYCFTLMGYIGIPFGGIGQGVVVIAFGLSFIPATALVKYPAGWRANTVKIIVLPLMAGSIFICWREAKYTIPPRYLPSDEVTTVIFQNRTARISLAGKEKEQLLHSLRWMFPVYTDVLGAKPDPVKISSSPYKLHVKSDNGTAYSYDISMQAPEVWVRVENNYYQSRRLYPVIQQLIESARREEDKS